MENVQLTPSQTEAFRDLTEGRENIFLTGGPGTGKSFLIREFLDQCPEKVPVVASTGAAAILIGGRPCLATVRQVEVALGIAIRVDRSGRTSFI